MKNKIKKNLEQFIDNHLKLYPTFQDLIHAYIHLEKENFGNDFNLDDFEEVIQLKEIDELKDSYR